MSEGRQISGRPFTPGSAPRQGRTPGSKNKISGRSLKVIDALLKDFTEHGAEAIKIMRLERPAEYVKCAMDVASRMAAAEHGNALVGANGEDCPTILVVRWGGDQQQQLNNDDNVIPLLELKAHASKTEGR